VITGRGVSRRIGVEGGHLPHGHHAGVLFRSHQLARVLHEEPGGCGDCRGHGRTWSAQYAAVVTRIVGERGDRIKVVVLDPEGSFAPLGFYAEMYGADHVEALRDRITEAINSWRVEVRRAKDEQRRAHVVVEGIRRHVPFTFYRSGDAMWVVMAPRAPGRTSEGIPADACVKTGNDSGLYDWVLKDIEACRREDVARQIEELKA
jgi:hypothetical protein